MSTNLDELGSLARYTAASEHAADQIIRAYSTSFGTATRLLGRRHRSHVRNIYALARVADELVDGATDEAGVSPDQQHRALTRLEKETDRAIDTGYSSNPIVHAFAHTARASGIGTELTQPFFRSMRTDIVASPRAHSRSDHQAASNDDRSTGHVVGHAAGDVVGHAAGHPADTSLQFFGSHEHANYVYGSAEVIGLMCLRVFVRDDQPTDELMAQLEAGAKSLGAAFQNVNFLRDLADDTHRLGRSYLSDQGHIDAAEQQRWIATIRGQLQLAAETLPLLPRDARLAVGCTLSLFSRLTDRLEQVSAAELYQRRVRVPAHEKAWLILRQYLTMRRGLTS